MLTDKATCMWPGCLNPFYTAEAFCVPCRRSLEYLMDRAILTARHTELSLATLKPGLIAALQTDLVED